MTFRTILVGVDGSIQSGNALDVATDLAKKYDASLLILHVVSVRPTSRMQADLQTYQRIENLRMTEEDILRSFGEEVVQNAEKHARQQGATKLERLVEVGDAATTIAATAKARKADLIVVGRRGLGEIGALVIGSVSHKLLQISDLPCLTVG
jgi:nucleotide-binding universal stress UspA family protein